MTYPSPDIPVENPASRGNSNNEKTFYVNTLRALALGFGHFDFDSDPDFDFDFD